MGASQKVCGSEEGLVGWEGSKECVSRDLGARSGFQDARLRGPPAELDLQLGGHCRLLGPGPPRVNEKAPRPL